MKKIWLIIKREYLTRVKKRSFVVMSILGPILMAAMLIVPVFLADISDEEIKKIAILDETGVFYNEFINSDNMEFIHVHENLETAKTDLFTKDYYALLYIPKTRVALPTSAVIYSKKQVGINIKSYIRNTLEKEIENEKLLAAGIDPDIIKSISTRINLNTIKISKTGEEEKSYTEVSIFLGIFSGLMIYFFIFMFGVQVLRGVIEEKSNRIVEIIISSVKPFQLMMGKITGIAMVGLTQFLIWVVFTFLIFTIFTGIYSDYLPAENLGTFSNADQLLNEQTLKQEMVEANKITEVFNAIFTINFGLMIMAFIIYFIGGYLLYGALFAAIGGAIDNDTDSQQFMLPITIPLILSILMLQHVIHNPGSSLSFWFSIIPFTSPVVMMIRLPFGVPTFDFILSVVLLIVGFLGTTWLAGKIYKTGILMYGSKVSYKTLWKWLRMKN